MNSSLRVHKDEQPRSESLVNAKIHILSGLHLSVVHFVGSGAKRLLSLLLRRADKPYRCIGIEHGGFLLAVSQVEMKWGRARVDTLGLAPERAHSATRALLPI